MRFITRKPLQQTTPSIIKPSCCLYYSLSFHTGSSILWAAYLKSGGSTTATSTILLRFQLRRILRTGNTNGKFNSTSSWMNNNGCCSQEIRSASDCARNSNRWQGILNRKRWSRFKCCCRCYCVMISSDFVWCCMNGECLCTFGHNGSRDGGWFI